MAQGDPERYQPLPPITRLPAWLWGKLDRRTKFIVGCAGAVFAVGAALLIASMVRTGDRVAEEQRRTEAAQRAERRRQLVADQRPRRAPVSTAAGLERAIDRDVRHRVARGLLPGPAGRTTCTPLGDAGQTPTTRSYNCFAQATSRRSTGRTIVSGQRFVARVDLRRRVGTWCKTNPRPLHPDTAHYVTVPISPRCQSPRR